LFSREEIEWLTAEGVKFIYSAARKKLCCFTTASKIWYENNDINYPPRICAFCATEFNGQCQDPGGSTLDTVCFRKCIGDFLNLIVMERSFRLYLGVVLYADILNPYVYLSDTIAIVYMPTITANWS
jgi:hypothetical protein